MVQKMSSVFSFEILGFLSNSCVFFGCPEVSEALRVRLANPMAFEKSLIISRINLV